jgi:hypothetical protein
MFNKDVRWESNVEMETSCPERLVRAYGGRSVHSAGVSEADIGRSEPGDVHGWKADSHSDGI